MTAYPMHFIPVYFIYLLYMTVIYNFFVTLEVLAGVTIEIQLLWSVTSCLDGNLKASATGEY